MEFEIFEHTADQAIRSYGKTQEQVFFNAAKALSHLSTDPKKVEPIYEFSIEVFQDEIDELLVSWLNELIFIQDCEGVYLVKFSIDTFEPPVLKGRAWGDKIDLNIHHQGACIKAATYHSLKFEETSDGWMGQVIFDV